jgi:hypothetical protein
LENKYQTTIQHTNYKTSKALLGISAMKRIQHLGIALLMGIAVSGCANSDIKPAQVLCPILGATLGAGIVGGGLGTSQGGAYAGGAVLGAAMGHFFCKERPRR